MHYLPILRRIVVSGLLLSGIVWAEDPPFPFQTPAPSPQPPSIVYRVDSRPPSLVFSDGFHSHGEDSNLVNHLLGGSYMSDSGFVATTSSLRAARMIVSRIQPPAAGSDRPASMWIYSIRATPRFFGVVRSLERAVEQLDGCDPTPQLQARVTNLDRLLAMARREAEWVVYGSIQPHLVQSATEYRLRPDEQDIADERERSIENPRYIDATTQGNTHPWLIPAMPTPARATMHRIYNHAQIGIATLRSRLQGMSAHWCISSGESSRKRRANDVPTPLDQLSELTLQHLKYTIQSAGRCNIPLLVAPNRISYEKPGIGSCQSPEVVRLESLPDGYVWQNGRPWLAKVPWHTRNVSNQHRHWRSYPSVCKVERGEDPANPPYVICDENPYFQEYMVALTGRNGAKTVNHVAGPAITGMPFMLKTKWLTSENGDSFTHLFPGLNGVQTLLNHDQWHSGLLVAPINDTFPTKPFRPIIFPAHDGEL